MEFITIFQCGVCKEIDTQQEYCHDHLMRGVNFYVHNTGD